MRTCQARSRCSVTEIASPSISRLGLAQGAPGGVCSPESPSQGCHPPPPTRAATLKKSSWWITQQLGSDLRRLLVSVVLPPLVMLWGEHTREAAWVPSLDLSGSEGPPRIRLKSKTQACRDFPGGPVVRTLRFHCRGRDSIPGWELRSRKPSCVAKNKTKENKHRPVKQ